jgi:hypothetical protein
MTNLKNLASRGFLKIAFLLDPPEASEPPKSVSDDFIKWLGFANAGMMDPGNLDLIDHAFARIHSDAPMVEVGSFCGLSANTLTHFKRRYHIKNPLITCDKWDFENDTKDRDQIGNSPVKFSHYKAFVRASFIRNIQLFSPDDLPFTVEVKSDEFFAMWKDRRNVTDVLGRCLVLGGPISFCYIDGDHTYEGVRQDFLNCDRWIEAGGFILFDDSNSKEFGVWRLMREMEANHRYSLISTRPNHLFQKLADN